MKINRSLCFKFLIINFNQVKPNRSKIIFSYLICLWKMFSYFSIAVGLNLERNMVANVVSLTLNKLCKLIGWKNIFWGGIIVVLDDEKSISYLFLLFGFLVGIFFKLWNKSECPLIRRTDTCKNPSSFKKFS